MKQDEALEVMLSGKSVFLTGPAGSGKTYILNRLIELKRLEGKRVSVTATTGLAASHLGGVTIHSWSGIGIRKSVNTWFINRLSKQRKKIIKRTNVLIIDEISMLHDFRLDLINQVCKQIRGNDRPFGGIQVILCGDFFQLPPVTNAEEQGGFVTGSRSWKELDLKVCYLAEVKRQEDGELKDILNALRANDIRQKHAKALLGRIGIEPEDEVTELHTTNVNVDRINEAKITELDGDEHYFDATHSGQKKYVESLAKSMLAPQRLQLKLGALVMAVKNSTKFVNGSTGRIVDFTTEHGLPVVLFDSGIATVIEPDVWEMTIEDERVASISQIPLRLAWAITVHKSQGMTLDAARIDLRQAFVDGMGYVALSRVRSLDKLYLYGINRRALRVSSEALRIDKELQRG